PTSNYVGSMGPECLDNFCNFEPYQPFCNMPQWGWTTSADDGTTSNPTDIRGMFARAGAKIALRDVRDGASNTLLLGETLPSQNRHMQVFHWYSTYGTQLNSTIIPINYPVDEGDTSWCGANLGGPQHSMTNNSVAWGFRSRHPAGANFAFVDGSVHFITQDIDYKTYQLLGCRNDGALAGAYKVTVTKSVPPPQPPDAEPGDSRSIVAHFKAIKQHKQEKPPLPAMYANEKPTPFRYTVPVDGKVVLELKKSEKKQ